MSSLNLTWLLTSDFNAIVSPLERKGGLFRQYATKSKLFADFIAHNNLLNLGFMGSDFT